MVQVSFPADLSQPHAATVLEDAAKELTPIHNL